MVKYINDFFIPMLDKNYRLSDDQHKKIKLLFIKRLKSLYKNKNILLCISYLSNIITGCCLLFIISIPYLLKLININSILLSNISTYIQTGTGILWSIYKTIYSILNISDKIFTIKGTISALELEGNTFISKVGRYEKFHNDENKYRKFCKKVEEKINYHRQNIKSGQMYYKESIESRPTELFESVIELN